LINYNEIKEVLRIGAKDNFVLFCYFVDFEFFQNRPFLKEIAQAFQDIADGKIKTLSVSLPPRAGKSYITSLFCAWVLGKYPQDSVMRNTCTATLARKLSYDAREILKGEKFQEVFSEIKLSDDRAAVDAWNTNKAKNVSYFGQGVGGTIIGFGATKVSITDDLFKSMEEAMSETIREKTHSWKEATHDSRKESGCAEIDIGTRWTRDDVIGKNSEGGYYDRQIIIPAMKEVDGEWASFCEAVMTTEEYLLKKKKTSEDIWTAEYMQQPVDVKGRLFENIRTFTDKEAIIKSSEGSLAYIDVADEGKDFMCMVVGHVVNKDIYITDVVYTKANTDVTVPLCAELLNRYKIPYCRVETNGMGAILLKWLRQSVETTELLGLSNKTNKETRIIMNSAYVLRKFKFLETDQGDYYQYIQGLKSFQKEGKNKNDDAPDATTGLSQMFEAFMPHLDVE
jgi:predicted phage terminase large subunit-like protein